MQEHGQMLMYELMCFEANIQLTHTLSATVCMCEHMHPVLGTMFRTFINNREYT